MTGWPNHLVTTFQKLHDADACPGGYGKLANYIRDQFGVTPKDFGMTRPIPVALILESNGLDDTIWTMRNAVERDADFDRFMRMLACDFAEHVLPIFEKRHPDDKRPRQCIEVARRLAVGEATDEERLEARRAAYDAAYDAAAADAYAAATAAADDAADDAADAAATAAAYADAAYAAERLWQAGRMREALQAEFSRCAATADEAAQRMDEAA